MKGPAPKPRWFLAFYAAPKVIDGTPESDPSEWAAPDAFCGFSTASGLRCVVRLELLPEGFKQLGVGVPNSPYFIDSASIDISTLERPPFVHFQNFTGRRLFSYDALRPFVQSRAL